MGVGAANAAKWLGKIRKWALPVLSITERPLTWLVLTGINWSCERKISVHGALQPPIRAVLYNRDFVLLDHGRGDAGVCNRRKLKASVTSSLIRFVNSPIISGNAGDTFAMAGETVTHVQR